MANRTVPDLVREQYFSLLPQIQRVLEHLEAEIRYHLLPILRTLNYYEQVVVKARVKDCESAITKLQRKQEGEAFDDDNAGSYSLISLNDLAALRVLVFPRSRLEEVDRLLRRQFPAWHPDPIVQDNQVLALKYSGYCRAEDRIRAEYQVVPVLTGLFWEIEHSALYKPSPELRGVVSSPEMEARRAAVLDALNAFEMEFERIVEQSRHDQRA